LPANDHPNGGSYETQSDRFGSGRSYLDMRETSSVRESFDSDKPTVNVEVTYTFTEEQVKQILAQYVRETFDKMVTTKDVTGDYRAATYGGYNDSSPAYCKFVVKARG